MKKYINKLWLIGAILIISSAVIFLYLTITHPDTTTIRLALTYWKEIYIPCFVGLGCYGLAKKFS